jgi:outer membrane protein
LKQIVLILSLACSFAACAQSSIPTAPVRQAPSAPAQASPLEQDGQATLISRVDAERMALKNNPRITASHLLALAAGQVTRETRSNELPQINGNLTAVKAEDGSRIGSGELNSSRLYTHAGAGGTLSQLLTDFGHTRDLVANSRLQAKAQQQNALATEQDVLIATDQAFYRLLDAQSFLGVAIATVKARGDVQNLTQALTKSALKSDLDLNISSADLFTSAAAPARCGKLGRFGQSRVSRASRRSP